MELTCARKGRRTSAVVFSPSVSPSSTYQIRIYDTKGNLVRALTGLGDEPQMEWDGEDMWGHTVTRGKYKAHLSGVEQSKTITVS